MTAIDDLKVGDWIAVTGIIEEVNKPEPSAWTAVWVCTTEAPKQHQDGYPLKILAISLPFICVQKDNQTATVDVRETQVHRLNWRYVKAVLSAPPPMKPKAKKKKEKPNPLTCPRCKEA